MRLGCVAAVSLVLATAGCASPTAAPSADETCAPPTLTGECAAGCSPRTGRRVDAMLACVGPLEVVACSPDPAVTGTPACSARVDGTLFSTPDDPIWAPAFPGWRQCTTTENDAYAKAVASSCK